MTTPNRWAIHCEDCLLTLKRMEDESIDLIVTDPAYKTISGGSDGPDKKHGSNRPRGVLWKNDGKIFEHNSISPSDYLPELYRVLKSPSHLYVMSNFYALEETMQEVRKAGFDIHNLMIWIKNNVNPSRWGLKNIEYIIFARKGKAFPLNDTSTKTTFHYDNPKSPKRHPTEKPVELMQKLIENSSKEGDLVYDPFTGSAATGIAALESGRRFVGSEIDEKYHTTATKRMEDWEPSGMDTLFI